MDFFLKTVFREESEHSSINETSSWVESFFFKCWDIFLRQISIVPRPTKTSAATHRLGITALKLNLSFRGGHPCSFLCKYLVASKHHYIQFSPMGGILIVVTLLQIPHIAESRRVDYTTRTPYTTSTSIRNLPHLRANTLSPQTSHVCGVTVTNTAIF